MNIIAGLIIAVASVENMLPLLIGYLNTPKDMIFLGSVHYPGDYFYYLSQFFANGSNLYTTETLPFSFIGWPNIVLGKLFSFVGISPLIAYHTSIAVFTIVLLFFSYKLALLILGNKKSATIALFLFTLYHSFPTGNSYGDYFNNFAIPRVRFGAVPHQLILSISSVLLMYFFIQKKKIGIALSSIVLASLQPIIWLLLSPIIFLGAWPMIIGIIPMVYLNKIFQSLPYTQLKTWEALQQTYLSPGHFLSATGPIFLIALIALPVFLKKNYPTKLFLTVFCVLSFLLFLSPVPSTLNISHVRFLSTLVILFLCMIASVVSNKWVLLILTALLLPNHYLMIQNGSNFKSDNAYHYIYKDQYELLRFAKSASTPKDTFLVIWPYNSIFPAVSGRKSYNGHPLLTINQDTKEKEAALFFDNKTTTIPNVNYVIGYTWSPKPPHGTLIKTSGNLVLYHIDTL